VIPPRPRRLLRGAAAVVFFLVLAGATYQGVATAIERRNFPHPGRLVGIGDRQLHIHCSGSGTPTVILEAAAGGMSAAWGWVQPAVAQFTRVCTYDRAGLGWSDAGNEPYDPSTVPDQLHALLEGAKESRPYILVGHGLGAAFATMYASRYPAEVAALVMIDPPAPGSAAGESRMRLVRASPWLARAGILRVTQVLTESARGLPGASGGAMSAFLNRPDHLTRAARELSAWNETTAMAAAAVPDPSIRVVGIAAAASGPLSLIAADAEAEKVSTAIVNVVAEVRTHGL
jgi:pimeloyl-ACP methyl ester carboxylesterase